MSHRSGIGRISHGYNTNFWQKYLEDMQCDAKRRFVPALGLILRCLSMVPSASPGSRLGRSSRLHGSYGRCRRRSLDSLLLVAFFCWSGDGLAMAEAEYRGPGLQVIVLVGESDPRLLEGKPYAVLELSNADLPRLISQSLVPSLVKRPLIRFSDFGLLEQVTFLDAHTFFRTEKKRDFWWSNEIAKLRFQIRTLLRHEESYSLSSCGFGPGSFSLILKGSYQFRRFEQMIVRGRIDRTTVAIQSVEDGTSLFFAFTWTDAMITASPDGRQPKDVDIRPPKLLHRPLPAYPERFLYSYVHPRFQVVVRVDTQGKVDANEFVILDCVHPLIAESAMKEILNSWRFAPASVNGEPSEDWFHIAIQY